MAGRRRHKRIIKRLDTEFSSGGSSFRGTSSNFSESGLFLRTQKPLPADTQVDVSIQLPDDNVSRIKGTVRWSLKSAMKHAKSGMGIEISEYDRHYVNFLNTLLSPEEQILYQEHKNAARPAAMIGQPACQESGPLVGQTVGSLPRHSEPGPLTEKQPPAARKIEHEPEDHDIDSLISSLFSKRDKK